MFYSVTVPWHGNVTLTLDKRKIKDLKQERYQVCWEGSSNPAAAANLEMAFVCSRTSQVFPGSVKGRWSVENQHFQVPFQLWKCEGKVLCRKSAFPGLEGRWSVENQHFQDSEVRIWFSWLEQVEVEKWLNFMVGKEVISNTSNLSTYWWGFICGWISLFGNICGFAPGGVLEGELPQIASAAARGSVSFPHSPARAAAHFSGFLSRFSPEQLPLEPCSVPACLGAMGTAGTMGSEQGQISAPNQPLRAPHSLRDWAPASCRVKQSCWPGLALPAGRAGFPARVGDMSAIIFGISLELHHPAAAARSSSCFQSCRDAHQALIPLCFLA